MAIANINGVNLYYEDIGIGDVWDTYKGDGVRVTVVDDGLGAC